MLQRHQRHLVFHRPTGTAYRHTSLHPADHPMEDLELQKRRGVQATIAPPSPPPRLTLTNIMDALASWAHRCKDPVHKEHADLWRDFISSHRS